MTDGTVFRFESDFAQSLRCIPMSVRLKLDLCGIKLTLRQWSRLTPEDRRWLAERACGTEAEAFSLRRELAALVAERTPEPVRYISIEEAPAWREAQRVPPSIIAKAHTLGIAVPSPEQWHTLSPLQRFALLKLTREGHESANFVPAMAEFGLGDEETARAGAD